MTTYKITITDEEMKRIEEWKAFAGKYNLTLDELRELVNHIDEIKRLLNK